MGSRLAKRLKDVFASEFPESKFIPEPAPPRIAGILLWPGFSRKNMATRQRMVSKAIGSLEPAEQLGVSIIMTYTPREYKVIESMNSSPENS
jgi:hypothetical protein